MTNQERLLDLGQKIYRTMNKSANQNITGSDLTAFLEDTIAWVNQFLPELELETDWNFSRVNDGSVGTVAADTVSYPLAATTRKLVFSPNRDLSIQQDGTVISTFKLVRPNLILDPTDTEVRDRATVVGRNLILSRVPTDEEVDGTLVADSIAYIPRLSLTDVTMLDIVDPIQLVVLGTAKNWILPDKVSGGLSASFAQQYAELVRLCKEANDATADANSILRDNFSYIGGVGF